MGARFTPSYVNLVGWFEDQMLFANNHFVPNIVTYKHFTVVICTWQGEHHILKNMFFSLTLIPQVLKCYLTYKR